MSFTFFFSIIWAVMAFYLCAYTHGMEGRFMALLAGRLQRLRLAKHLSRRQLEIQAAIPHGIISRLERGEQEYPSVPVAMRVAKVLGVSVDYLIGMYEDDDTSEEYPTELATAGRES